MNRPRTLLVLAVLLAGCRSAPQGDPFLLGRSTIPPPGTGAIGPNGAQASLAPPARAMIPPQSMPATAPPTMNSVPLTPAPPSMNAPPAANPYNFHQGSLKSSDSDATAGNWTPLRQTVATVNRADGSETSAKVTAGKTTSASPTIEVAAATEAEDEVPQTNTTKSEIKVTSLQESTNQMSGKSATNKSLPEPAKFIPQGNVIRIIEPGAKSDADSAAQAKPSTTMTASSFQPQWQKWTDGATE